LIFYQTHVSVYYPANDPSWTANKIEHMTYETNLWWPVEDPGSVELPKEGDPLAGRCGKNAYWKIENGALIVYGSGAMVNHPWKGYFSQFKDAVIADGITSICYSAFGSSLERIDIADSVQHIEGYAFSGCKKLVEVRLPKALTKIEQYTFSNCESLKKIYFPANLKKIDSYAFQNCASLGDIQFNEGLEEISSYAFYGSGVTSVEFPKSFKKIAGESFGRCDKLTRVVFLGDAPEVTGYPFEVEYAYGYYPAGNKTWDKDVRPYLGGPMEWSAGTGALQGSCGSNLTWKYSNGVLTISGTGKMDDYDEDSVAPWSAKRGEIKKVTVANGVTYIGSEAFWGMSKLEDVSLPDSVTAIGGSTFRFCQSLKSLRLPKNLTKIPEFCFNVCDQLKTITIPEGGYGN
jgi:hypothetical protein